MRRFERRAAPFFSVGVGLGGRALGRQYGEDLNRLELKPYALLDATVWYKTGPVRFTLTGNNLADSEDYFVSAINSTQLTPGPGRVLLAQVSAEL